MADSIGIGWRNESYLGGAFNHIRVATCVGILTWLTALEKANLIRTKNLGVSDEELLNDLIRVAQELKKEKTTTEEYNERGSYHSSTLTHRFGLWFKALENAGLKRTRNLNISNDELFNSLVEVWTLLGHQPKYNDLKKDISKYSSGTYEKRFGGWRKASCEGRSKGVTETGRLKTVAS